VKIDHHDAADEDASFNLDKVGMAHGLVYVWLVERESNRSEAVNGCCCRRRRRILIMWHNNKKKDKQNEQQQTHARARLVRETTTKLNKNKRQRI